MVKKISSALEMIKSQRMSSTKVQAIANTKRAMGQENSSGARKYSLPVIKVTDRKNMTVAENAMMRWRKEKNG